MLIAERRTISKGRQALGEKPSLLTPLVARTHKNTTTLDSQSCLLVLSEGDISSGGGVGTGDVSHSAWCAVSLLSRAGKGCSAEVKLLSVTLQGRNTFFLQPETWDSERG